MLIIFYILTLMVVWCSLIPHPSSDIGSSHSDITVPISNHQHDSVSPIISDSSIHNSCHSKIINGQTSSSPLISTPSDSTYTISSIYLHSLIMISFHMLAQQYIYIYICFFVFVESAKNMCVAKCTTIFITSHLQTGMAVQVTLTTSTTKQLNLSVKFCYLCHIWHTGIDLGIE
jgi:hypothetical protein